MNPSLASLLYPEHIFYAYSDDVQYLRWTQNHQESQRNDQRNQGWTRKCPKQSKRSSVPTRLTRSRNFFISYIQNDKKGKERERKNGQKDLSLGFCKDYNLQLCGEWCEKWGYE